MTVIVVGVAQLVPGIQEFVDLRTLALHHRAFLVCRVVRRFKSSRIARCFWYSSKAQSSCDLGFSANRQLLPSTVCSLTCVGSFVLRCHRKPKDGNWHECCHFSSRWPLSRLILFWREFNFNLQNRLWWYVLVVPFVHQIFKAVLELVCPWKAVDWICTCGRKRRQQRVIYFRDQLSDNPQSDSSQILYSWRSNVAHDFLSLSLQQWKPLLLACTRFAFFERNGPANHAFRLLSKRYSVVPIVASQAIRNLGLNRLMIVEARFVVVLEWNWFGGRWGV